MDFKFTGTDFCCFLAAGAIGAGYLATKHWLLNNLFGLSFATNGVGMLNLGSFGVGATLLVGLFFYDIFWVRRMPRNDCPRLLPFIVTVHHRILGCCHKGNCRRATAISSED